MGRNYFDDIVIRNAKFCRFFRVDFNPGIPHDRGSGIRHFLQPGLVGASFSQYWGNKWIENKITVAIELDRSDIESLIERTGCIRSAQAGGVLPPAAILLELGPEGWHV